MNLQPIKLNSFFKTLTIVGAFVFSFALANQALAVDSATLRAKNITHSTGTYSTSNTYATEVRAEPGDTLGFRIIYSSATAATSIVVTLPADLTFADSVVTSSGNAASAAASGQNITFTFASATFEIITFNATVVSGTNLSATHTSTANYTTNGAPATSDNATIKTGPILKTISPSTGLDSAEPITGITLTGHGFTQTSDITSLTINGQSMTTGGISVTGPDGSGYYTISGARVPSGVTVGTYYVVLTTTVSTTALATNADSAESVAFIVTDGTEPVMSSAPSYVHSTGVLTLAFNETIDVSATDLSKITLYDASSGGTLSQILTGAAVSTTDSATTTITLIQAQKNAVSAAGVAASNLYVQIAGSGVYDLSGNAVAAQGSRTAITTWTKDAVPPTATLAYTQNNATITSAKAGDVTITATFSEPISATPNIAVDQPGATDIAATAMTGSGTTWIYTYTLNAAADGTATTTITNAPDYANNTLSTVASNTFVIDTLGPTPAISTLAAPSSTLSTADLTWTPTYTAGDFSTYKIYYRTASGVTAANGTLVSVANSATASHTISGLAAGTNYYFVIYICDQAGNCSSVSNEATLATTPNGAVVIVAPTSGGGGSSAPNTASTASSAKTFDAAGGGLTTTVGNFSAAILVPANTVSGNIAVAEASIAEKQAAPLAAAQGTIIGNTVFNIQLSGSTNPTFANPITLEFAYDPAQLGSINPSVLNISYFDTSLNKWVSLASTVNTMTNKVTAQTTHFTLFAITTVPYVGAPNSGEPAPAPSAPETGIVLGTSVGIYPNGTLLKAPNSPAIWHISGDKKHVIPSAAVFNTRFNWADIVYLPSDKQLNLYETGEVVKFAPNTLIKEQGISDVYRVSITGDLQGIVSMDVFLKRAYKVSDIIEVEPNGLAGYGRAAYISDVNYVYTGELVSVPLKTGLSSVYYIEGGQAREFKTRDIFDRHGLKLKNVHAITASQLKTYPTGAAMLYPDGTLVKGKGTAVYLMSDGKKRAIKSGKDLDALLYNRKRIKVISDTDLNKISTGTEVKII